MMTDADRYDLQRQARDDLSRYRDAKRDIKHLEQILDNLRDQALASSWDTSDRVQSQSNASESFAVVVADLTTRYKQQQTDAEKLCLELERRVSTWLTGVERRAIRSYYLFSTRVEQIAIDEGYSYRHIKRIMRSGLINYGSRLAEIKTDEKLVPSCPPKRC